MYSFREWDFASYFALNIAFQPLFDGKSLPLPIRYAVGFEGISIYLYRLCIIFLGFLGFFWDFFFMMILIRTCLSAMKNIANYLKKSVPHL